MESNHSELLIGIWNWDMQVDSQQQQPSYEAFSFFFQATHRQDSVVSSNVLFSPVSHSAGATTAAVDMSNETEDLDPPLHVKRMMRMRSLRRFAFGE